MYERFYNLLLEGLSDAAKKYKAVKRGHSYYATLDYTTKLQRKNIKKPTEYTNIENKKAEEIFSTLPKVPTSSKRNIHRAKSHHNTLINKLNRLQKTTDRRVFNSKHPERN